MSRIATIGIVVVACSPAVGRPDDRPAPALHGHAPAAAVSAPALPAAVASCVDGAPYDPAIMRARIARLAAPELDGRAPGTSGDLATRAFITDQFRCLGLAPAFADYAQPFTAEGAATANVVGFIAGSDPHSGDIILVAAHHDHLGHGHLGANDNASGVVALLAIAQAIRQEPVPPPRTIVFATFGGEEGGMLGSYYYAAHPPDGLALDRVVQVINLDMVGSHASHKLVAAMGAFARFPARTILDKLVPAYPKLSVVAGGRARGSDFEPFCKLGIPYVFFWTPDERCYHETCDTADRIDLPRMTEIAQLAGKLTERLATSELDLAGARRRLGCGVR